MESLSIAPPDWNGDRFDEVGVFRDDFFLLDMNGNGQWDGPTVDRRISFFAAAGDTPVAGDWDGDGVDEIGVRRGNRFYLDVNGDGVWSGGPVDVNKAFGRDTDIPVIGDWNGDGLDDL